MTTPTDKAKRRPSGKIVTTVTLTPDALDMLAQLAESRGMARNAYLEGAIRDLYAAMLFTRKP